MRNTNEANQKYPFLFGLLHWPLSGAETACSQWSFRALSGAEVPFAI